MQDALPEKQAPYRLALLAHSTELVDLVKAAMAERTEEIIYEYVDFETGPERARALLDSGYEAIVCHGGTGNTILQAIGHSVAAIDRTDTDIIKILQKAKRVSRRVILAVHQHERHEIREVELLLDLEVCHISYTSHDVMFDEIRRAFDRGIKVLVGGGLSKKFMEDLGGTGFVIEPSLHSVHLALDRARALAHQKREENKRHADLVAIFTQLQEGVICIDNKERVVFSNPLAAKMLGLPPRQPLSPFYELLGLKEVLHTWQPKYDAVVSMAGESFVVRTFPLAMRGNVPCAVAFFRDVPSLQKINKKIGEELYAKGFVARTSLPEIIGENTLMLQMKSKIRRFAQAEAAILINGETGTGKELVAHALHMESPRRKKPFVAVNFASLSPSLIESEIFGYEEGAFTGAKRGGKMGLFEMADQGTLFLDEVGEISHEMQIRLLRILEAHEVMRVGGSRIFPVNVKIISASHQQLHELVKAGKFRLDLYYRLSTLKLNVPPLRDRVEDIPLILAKLLQRYGETPASLSAEVLRMLCEYHWPGNIRELLSLVESYLILRDKQSGDIKLLRELLTENKQVGGQQAVSASRLDPLRSLKDNMDMARTEFIQQAVDLYGGDRQLAALRLGVSYTTLWRTLKG